MLTNSTQQPCLDNNSLPSLLLINDSDLLYLLQHLCNIASAAIFFVSSLTIPILSVYLKLLRFHGRHLFISASLKSP